MRRGFVVAVVVAGAAACVHIIDPRTAANTEVGLQVWVSVTPLTLSISDTVTRLRFRVSARNPGGDTIRVDNGGTPCELTTDPSEGRGLLHSMRIGSDDEPLQAGPAGDVCGSSLLVFPPRRTRQRDFYVSINDWRVQGYPVAAGEYRARSWFAGYEGYSTIFELVP